MERSADILLVEDDNAVRRVVADILSLLGYAVLTAPSGEEGWMLFREHGARAVITDNSMEGMSGTELARRVKAQSPHTRVVLLSSIAPDSGRLCDATLGKPVTFRDLEQCLAGLGVLPGRA